MKSTQLKQKKEEIKNNLSKNSIIAGIIGFLSWILLFVIFIPFAGLYKFGNFGQITPLNMLKVGKLYSQSFFVGLSFFLFFYLTLKHKEKSQAAKIIMWAGIILYSLFYLGYLFLLFFFRFTDL